jgi:hypothetical protein
MEASRLSADFSLVEGGLLFELQRSAHLVRVRHDIFRRALLLALLGWLPAVILAALTGGVGHGQLVPLHTRFLVSIPILLWAEGFVDSRVQAAVVSFVQRGIVAGDDLPRFHEVVARAARLRDSRWAVAVIAVVAVGLSVMADLTGHAHRVGAADWWIGYVSLPLFRLVLLAWVWRWSVWVLLLAGTARLDLRLVPTHPDLAGGLGFLEQAAVSFLVVLVGVGAALSGDLTLSMTAEHANLTALVQPSVGFGVIVVTMVLGPLLLFARKLVRAKRRGQLEYGALAYHHNRLFGEKWRGQPVDNPLGAPEISSLADIGASYSFVDRMRPLPVGRLSRIEILVVCAAPALPAILQKVPLSEMVTRVLKGLLM